jgi:hypothetical protein
VAISAFAGAAAASIAVYFVLQRKRSDDEELLADWGSHGFIGPARKQALESLVVEKRIFDVHCHFYDYMQETEGVYALTSAMDRNGVGYAALCGCPFKKTWVGVTEKDLETPPAHHLYDDGDLYCTLARSAWPPMRAPWRPRPRTDVLQLPVTRARRTDYSATDGNVHRQLTYAMAKGGASAIARFSMLGCGMNIGDYSCGVEAAHLIENYPMVAGIGEVRTYPTEDRTHFMLNS